jgi:hypothetical protein
MSILSRRQASIREVLSADTLRIAEAVLAPEPDSSYIDSFEQLQLVLVTGSYATYGGIVLEANADSNELLVKWYEPQAATWMVNWWHVTRVTHMHYGIPADAMREVARELLKTGRLPRNKVA